MAVPEVVAGSKEVAKLVAGDTALLFSLEESSKLSRRTHDLDPMPDEAWRQFTETIPFLGVPPEIHLKIFTFLNPIDTVCLGLVK